MMTGGNPQEHFNLPVAERCYAVLGDVAKSRYLHKVPGAPTLGPEEQGNFLRKPEENHRKMVVSWDVYCKTHGFWVNLIRTSTTKTHR